MCSGLSLCQEKAAEEMARWRDVLQYPGKDSYRLLTNKVTLIQPQASITTKTSGDVGTLCYGASLNIKSS